MPWFRCDSRKPGRFRKGMHTFRSSGFEVRPGPDGSLFFHVFIPDQHHSSAVWMAKEWKLKMYQEEPPGEEIAMQAKEVKVEVEVEPVLSGLCACGWGLKQGQSPKALSNHRMYCKEWHKWLAVNKTALVRLAVEKGRSCVEKRYHISPEFTALMMYQEGLIKASELPRAVRQRYNIEPETIPKAEPGVKPQVVSPELTRDQAYWRDFWESLFASGKVGPAVAEGMVAAFEQLIGLRVRHRLAVTALKTSEDNLVQYEAEIEQLKARIAELESVPKAETPTIEPGKISQALGLDVNV